MKRPIPKIAFVFVLLWHSLDAQHEGITPSLTDLPQVVYFNPANQSAYHFSLGLPFSSLYAQYANSNFRLSDFATRNSANDLDVDLDRLARAAGNKNYLTVVGQAEIFRMSMRLHPRFYFTSAIQAKSYMRVMVPKYLVAIVADRAASNGTFELAPVIDAMAYLEISFSGSYVVNRKLNIGVAVKQLRGVGHATTGASRISISRNDDNMTLMASIDARTAGYDEDEDIELERYRDYLQNKGWAFDIGATYQLNDRITLGASILDIGWIAWKHKTKAYELQPANASYTFPAPDVEAILNGDDDSLEGAEDSFEDTDLSERNIAGYSTTLPTRIYVSSTYKLTRTINASAGLIGEIFRSRFAPAFSLALHKQFGRRAGLSLSYLATHRTYNNIGVGFNLNFAPFQFYITTDNAFQLLASNTDEFTDNVQFANVRTGLNLVFGRIKQQSKARASR